ncbi:hypothetical protein [Mucilaginibacter boryungensis]|uniref:Uncharacterized protein n=1 Tax=Mucilaginibacter boryungensis TaxID=768480 RepID=A0ABR9XLM0_9SPHI|nr:hypothetical protein [Mucilaginibacter boryungensis]MBE9668268.1 hypothetical protein [Mucilaginibacter boryungensis]
MEITVAMLITALVIAITYTCYTIVYKSYISYRVRQSKLTEVNQLTQTLTRDMERGEIVIQQQNGILIKGKTEAITYQIQPEYVLRLKGATDTFKVNATDFTGFFEGQPLARQNESEEQNRLDEISFTIIFGDDKIPYHYFKSYSSQNLINRNPNAIN